MRKTFAIALIAAFLSSQAYAAAGAAGVNKPQDKETSTSGAPK